MRTRVTVVIPSYNPGRYLRGAVASVFGQTYRRWRLVLVDDASTDASLHSVEDYLDSPRVNLVRHPENLGQSKALNTALAIVETPYLVQLDADDWFLPRALEVLVAEAERQPAQVAVVSANIRVDVEADVSPFGRSYSFVRKGRAFRDRYQFLTAGTSLWPRLYRTAALRFIGGWPTDDPYEGRHMEDLRVLLRLVQHFRFHWVDAVLYVHRRHKGNNSRRAGVYAEVLKWAAGDALRRWGDRYSPVFGEVEPGWTVVVGLVPRRS